MITAKSPGPGKQKRAVKKQYKAMGKAIAQKQADRTAAYNADPYARKGGAYAEKNARFNPNLELNENGMYKGMNTNRAGRKRGVNLRPKYGHANDPLIPKKVK